MTVTREELSEYYKSLDDEALLDLYLSGELTPLAQGVASDELRRRGINHAELSKDAGAPKGTTPRRDLVMLTRLWTPIEAEMLRARLHAEGVNAFVFDAQIVQTTALMPLAFGGVRVMVPASQLDLAQEILRGIQAEK